MRSYLIAIFTKNYHVSLSLLGWTVHSLRKLMACLRFGLCSVLQTVHPVGKDYGGMAVEISTVILPSTV